MIIVMNRFSVTPGREADFEAAFRDRAKLVDQQPGFLCQDVLKPVGKGVFLTMTRWASMAAFEAWTQSDAFKQGHARRHPGMFAGHPQLEIYEVFESTWK
ncbi:MAG: antibiotic biosynthesis monooxygenase [Planctomycetes bacterium]|nr:antibiotic biosynthesis monooxygenase [Planctomycetota bacterium]